MVQRAAQVDRRADRVTKSDQIRDLAKQGIPIAEIARKLGIRYQFAYGVVSRSTNSQSAEEAAGTRVKPALTTGRLLDAGFCLSAVWIDNGSGAPCLSAKVPKSAGVYAFAVDGVAVYVGLASMGLSKRIYFYQRPGSTQRTSLRLNAMLCDLLREQRIVEIYTAMPEDGEWNGLPVDRCAGLELGLIRRFDLPWNKRSAR